MAAAVFGAVCFAGTAPAFADDPPPVDTTVVESTVPPVDPVPTTPPPIETTVPTLPEPVTTSTEADPLDSGATTTATTVPTRTTPTRRVTRSAPTTTPAAIPPPFDESVPEEPAPTSTEPAAESPVTSPPPPTVATTLPPPAAVVVTESEGTRTGTVMGVIGGVLGAALVLGIAAMLVRHRRSSVGDTFAAPPSVVVEPIDLRSGPAVTSSSVEAQTATSPVSRDLAAVFALDGDPAVPIHSTGATTITLDW